MEKLEGMFQQINTRLQQIDGKLESLVIELTTVKQENTKLKEQNAKQEIRIAALERVTRKKNLVIKGVTEDENESFEETEKKIETLLRKIGVDMNTDTDVDEIRRIGIHKAGKSRPIIMKLTKEKQKTDIQKKARNLKGTEIWIDEDYTKEIQEERKQLIPYLKEARQKGFKAQLRYNKLIINNEVFDARNILHKQDQEQRKNKEEGASSSHKRLVSERSPEGNSFTEQLKKITKTARTKN